MYYVDYENYEIRGRVYKGLGGLSHSPELKPKRGDEGRNRPWRPPRIINDPKENEESGDLRNLLAL